MEEICGGRGYEERHIRDMSKPYPTADVLEQEHRRSMNKALYDFDNKKMGGTEMSDTFRKELVKEMEDLYSELAANNERKYMYRMFYIPIVFLPIMILGLLTAVVATTFGIQILVAVGELATITAALMLVGWGYTSVSENLREVGMPLDNIAGTMTNFMHQYVLTLPGNHSAAAVETANYTDSKKDA